MSLSLTVILNPIPYPHTSLAAPATELHPLYLDRMFVKDVPVVCEKYFTTSHASTKFSKKLNVILPIRFRH